MDDRDEMLGGMLGLFRSSDRKLKFGVSFCLNAIKLKTISILVRPLIWLISKTSNLVDVLHGE